MLQLDLKRVSRFLEQKHQSALHLFTMQKGQERLLSLQGPRSFASRIKRHTQSSSNGREREERGGREEKSLLFHPTCSVMGTCPGESQENPV